MANSALLYFLFVSAVFHKGLNSVIQAQRNVAAAVGEQACLNCLLIQTKEVLQVTWQKILPDGERTVATDNLHFGQRVDPYFSGKVEFRDAGLQNTSILIREVTEQDEGYYRCMFNTYPDGALTATICLNVHELHEPVLHVRESNSSEEVVVSCSATGRPAPTVTITLPHQDLNFFHNTSVSVRNNNSTVTVTKTAVLSRRHDNSTQVTCTVGGAYGVHKEVFKMIPEVKKSLPDEKSGANSRSRSRTSIIILSALTTCVIITAVVFFRRRHKPQNSLSHEVHMNEKPGTTDEHPQKTQESPQENVQVRLRSTPVKSEERTNTNPTPVSSRRLFE
ncbi:OX-2 membrane glycoprotein-like isoform X1 [Labrus bergylta]|uniref:OX-2 membrane glycoprotein-like isoform X1 n=1 Tax=Labrus bergylta TaxID=56723 RepID=UPI003313FC21